MLAASSAPAVAGSRAVIHGHAYFGCETRTPLGAANIVLKSGSFEKIVRTDARGAYAFVGVEPGAYQIGLTHAGALVQRAVILDADDTAVANIGVNGVTTCEPRTVRVDAPMVDRYTIR